MRESKEEKKSRMDHHGYLRRFDGTPVHREVWFLVHPETPEELHIHHVNGDKTDNRIENLIALTPGQHKKLHAQWPMWDLPKRKEIKRWLRNKCKVGGRYRNEEQKLKKSIRRELRRNYLATGRIEPSEYASHWNVQATLLPMWKLQRARLLKTRKPKVLVRRMHETPPGRWTDNFTNQRWELWK